MSLSSGSVQESFLRYLIEHEEAVTVFLVNGVKLQGIVMLFDEYTILLRREGHVQLVYKTAISTIMPIAALASYIVSIEDETGEV
ncbi:RNA chaperone Hfq [Acetobacteraceae bacterium ESL0709]|nr:RNA chaperone Hfq [Acetobacteraceae bacterium ESL0697]MDF7677319.1 RNA chaperone Hfq [Acetobacteraceae bacterium ESL0709]